MKTYFLIPLAILTGCSSPRVVQMPPQPSTMLSPEQTESVRYAESVKAYPIGRYVDPNNDSIMHGAQRIYRVETTAKWNLHPDASADASLGPPVALIDSAKYNAPVNAEVIAEVNKQRAATEALLERNSEFNQSLSQLARAVQAVKQENVQTLQMKQELTTTEKRLDAFENELRNKQADSFGANQNTNTNEW
ncbi:MAG: hypothetical protein ACREDS_12385 [Limisphaerales bacterium]